MTVKLAEQQDVTGDNVDTSSQVLLRHKNLVQSGEGFLSSSDNHHLTNQSFQTLPPGSSPHVTGHFPHPSE